jgi:hypothetical protein
VVYAHKTHEKMADDRTTALWRLKWGQIIVSAITASGAVSSVFFAEAWIALLTALFSLLALIFSGYAKDIDPGAAAQKHRDTAADLWGIRESYLSLLTDVAAPGSSLEVIRRRRDELQAKLQAIYKGAPRTYGKAYAKAQQALKKDEDLTFSTQEIDHFLPEPLKRAQAKPSE